MLHILSKVKYLPTTLSMIVRLQASRNGDLGAGLNHARHHFPLIQQISVPAAITYQVEVSILFMIKRPLNLN